VDSVFGKSQQRPAEPKRYIHSEEEMWLLDENFEVVTGVELQQRILDKMGPEKYVMACRETMGENFELVPNPEFVESAPPVVEEPKPKPKPQQVPPRRLSAKAVGDECCAAFNAFVTRVKAVVEHGESSACYSYRECLCMLGEILCDIVEFNHETNPTIRMFINSIEDGVEGRKDIRETAHEIAFMVTGERIAA
jgi:hypothetical protein